MHEVTPQAARPTFQWAGLRVSVFVLGSGLLIVVSLVVPFFEVPFGGDRYFQWLSAVTVLLGTISLLRKERGPLAGAAALVALGAAGLLILTVIVPLAYVLAMRLLMPD